MAGDDLTIDVAAAQAATAQMSADLLASGLDWGTRVLAAEGLLAVLLAALDPTETRQIATRSATSYVADLVETLAALRHSPAAAGTGRLQ